MPPFGLIYDIYAHSFVYNPQSNNYRPYTLAGLYWERIENVMVISDI